MRNSETKLRVAVAATEAERNQLIQLRTRIYQQAGKHESPQAMTDIFDQKALIVGVWKNSKPIATARVMALDPVEEWEHDRFISWDDLLPSREETAEISRFCIDCKERSWTTIKALCSGIARAVAMTRRRYFLACCTEELVSFYKTFFGANFLGRSIIHSDLGTKEHFLFVCDYQPGMVGVNLKLVPWISLWAKPAQEGLRDGTLLSWIPRWQRKLFYIKCAIGGLAEPLADKLVNNTRHRRKTKSSKMKKHYAARSATYR